MKIAILVLATVLIGVGAVFGVYQFQESRLMPADLDAMREADRKLVEAEEALDGIEIEVETEPSPNEQLVNAVIDLAQADGIIGTSKEWKQIDTPEWSDTEPFHVKFACSMGDFVVEFHPEWSPNGVKRLHELIDIKFFDDCRFFRVIDGFIAQWGMHGDPAMTREWEGKTIDDDPVVESNKRGYVTFAMGGPRTRTTQLFVNFGNNERLDNYGAGFPPIGKVVEGLDVVDKIYSGYGGAPSEGGGGRGPEQSMLKGGGNKYLEQNFPKLDYIKKARFVAPVEATADDESDEAA